ncbi:hypothetical protein ACQR3P_29280 [Rhodococcus sp. IEGM1300]
MNKLTIICILGASGSGKTTIAKELEKAKIPAVVSHRTRKARKGEVHGVDGYFVSRSEFEAQRDRGGFCALTEYAGNLYGLSWGELKYFRSIRKEAVTYVVDAQGLVSLKEEISKSGKEDEYEVISFGVMSTREEIIERLGTRGEEDIEKRSALIERDTKDIIGVVDYLLANANGKMGSVVDTIKGIVI